MQLTGLLTLIRENAAYRDFVSHLKSNSAETLKLNIVRSARPFFTAALAQDWPAPIIYLTAQVKRAHNVASQLPVWLGEADEARSALRFAEPTPQFYERVPWGKEVIRGRLETLAALMPPDEDEPHTPPIIVASARALMQRTMPINQFRRGSMLIERGQRHNIEKLLASWIALGYEATPIVIEPGTFSRRGGMIDIFPIAATQPSRIEFFDDEIDSLRRFEVATQRSEGQIQRVAITPAREALPTQGQQVAAYLAEWFKSLQPAQDDMTSAARDAESLTSGSAFAYLEHYIPFMYPNPISLLDYAPQNTLIVIEDWDDLRASVNEITDHAYKASEEQLKAGQIAPDHPQPFVDWAALEAALKERTVIELTNAADFTTTNDPSLHTLNTLFTSGERYGGQLRPMLTRLRDLRSKGGRVIVVTQQAIRLTELWYEQDSSGFIPTVNNLTDSPSEESLIFVNGVLQEGWTLQSEDGIRAHLLTDAEIFGWNRPEPRRSKAPKRSRLPEADYADWKAGDFVVHVDYGIGKFEGMRHRTVEGNEREYLIVQYDGTDTLFVPIHQADRLTRYVGADDHPPALNKLGQPDWTRTRSRAGKAIEDEAKNLLALYAERAEAAGYAFQPDTHWQHELEAAFPFVETDDQLRAVREVKADMEAAHPMDRLICGDVGYGKTEVALRAAFKAVMDGKQVAVLVPTTVLAQQHYETFSSRLSPFPLMVEMMSRFRT
ncbi:MAG: DEAD/DEAH box helicase, partial [Chitinophagaceae bacterium]|nr:DEAD/DEAH box helicase [Anaerolineae bacterium]